MKKIYVKIEGITCDHCRQKIKSAFLRIKGVDSVDYVGSIAQIKYKGQLDPQTIVDTIINLDYYTNLKMVNKDIKKIKAVLGYEPKVFIDQGIESFVGWVKNETIHDDSYDKSILELKTKGLYK